MGRAAFAACGVRLGCVAFAWLRLPSRPRRVDPQYYLHGLQACQAVYRVLPQPRERGAPFALHTRTAAVVVDALSWCTPGDAGTGVVRRQTHCKALSDPRCGLPASSAASGLAVGSAARTARQNERRSGLSPSMQNTRINKVCKQQGCPTSYSTGTTRTRAIADHRTSQACVAARKPL